MKAKTWNVTVNDKKVATSLHTLESAFDCIIDHVTLGEDKIVLEGAFVEEADDLKDDSPVTRERADVQISEDSDAYSLRVLFIKRKELSEITQNRLAKVCTKLLKQVLNAE